MFSFPFYRKAASKDGCYLSHSRGLSVAGSVTVSAITGSAAGERSKTKKLENTKDHRSRGVHPTTVTLLPDCSSYMVKQVAQSSVCKGMVSKGPVLRHPR